MKPNINQIGQIVALLSFVLGTCLLSFYLFFGEDLINLGFALTYVIIALIINFIVFIVVIINGLFTKNNKGEALKTCGLMALNIPIAILYFYMVILFPNQNLI
ncbi:hypothetical protein [Psychroserpens sp.]|uniref:hypothetical protein n=1 Tax=Psychroserpens sp. TaxID=2020870 RepID=UPI002B267F29|nr:hypothetical protein [Psychroserpens sp.]